MGGFRCVCGRYVRFYKGNWERMKHRCAWCDLRYQVVVLDGVLRRQFEVTEIAA